MKAIALITAPTAYPLTTDEAKAHLRVDGSSDDAVITAYLSAATNISQNYMQRQLMQAVYELQMDTWPVCGSIIQLDRSPLVSVDSIKYTDPSGVEQTLDPSFYEVYKVKVPGFIRFIGNNLPALADRLDAVKVKFIAGYGDAAANAAAQQAAIPEGIKAGIKLQLGHLFENRQDEIVGATVSQLFNGSERILHPYRLYL